MGDAAEGERLSWSTRQTARGPNSAVRKCGTTRAGSRSLEVSLCRCEPCCTAPPARGLRPRRVAMLSVHTSPLDQPGTGDAGGMNVYVVEIARRLAGAASRSRSSPGPPPATCRPRSSWRPGDGPARDGRAVRGPGQGGPARPAVRVHRRRPARPRPAPRPGYYDLVHSHYWLSGQVGWLAAERWGVPLVHSMHTMAKVKNPRWPTATAPNRPAA